MMNALIKNNFIFYILCFIFYSPFSPAEKIVFNIDNSFINRVIFNNSFDKKNVRDYLEIYNENELIGKIPSFDEDGGNRLDKVLSRYDGANIIRIVTTFPDKGGFKIFYDLGFNKNHKLLKLNRVSFEFQEWQPDDSLYLKYCGNNINVDIEKLQENNDWFHTIRPSVDGWRHGAISGDCIESNKSINFENTYQVITKSYLYDQPSINSKTNMYLIKNDYIELIKKKNDFYQIKYITNKNKAINKWLHCSAIDAC